MNTIPQGDAIAVALGATMALALCWRGLASHRLPVSRLALMGAMWVAIFALTAAAARLFNLT